MRKTVLAAMVVAMAASLGLVGSAQAFHHKVRTYCIAYYPGLYSFAPCGCGYPPYVYPCTFRYPKFCGPKKSYWNGYLVGGCAPRGYGCASCCAGGSCGGGCYGGGCGDGCSSCGVGGSAESDEKVLYDGPAPGPAARPEAVAPPEPVADPSAGNQQTTFRLASQTSRDGSGLGAFSRGLRSYWDGNMNEALVGFDAAAAAEPQNALYQYYRALAVYNQQGAEAASQWLQQAVALERQTPVANYGKRMERVQGRVRVWIEQARAEAGLGGR